ncbi:hypothetical protein [Curtobacterium sp. MCBA15_016]|uniref:hypothetical protein n=1 Tax=Curtobacterium sp. MCBA15_016 TaxID=1898740 RepID=UPI001113B5D2|nr:hypothetical protein [Curtobacterium sp. MCBA15_016]
MGATIGVVGTASVSRNARRYAEDQARATALEHAIENLLRSLVDVTATADEWRRLVDLWTGNPATYPKGRPQMGAVSMALELVKLRAPASERDATDRLSAAWDRIANGEASPQPNAYGLFARAVVAWRAGEGLAATEHALRQAVMVAENGLVNDDEGPRIF